MKILDHPLRHVPWPNLFVALLLIVDWPLAAQRINRPVPKEGPDADTLLIYANRRAPYSLYDGVDLLTWQLGSVATRITPVAMGNVSMDRLREADYVVVYCPVPEPELSAAVIRFMNQTNAPVLWIGFGVTQLQNLPPYFEQFQSRPDPVTQVATNVFYRGQSRALEPWPFLEIAIPSNSHARVHISVPDHPTSASPLPVSWTSASTTFFAGIPSSFSSGALFGDSLLDFYGIEGETLPEPRLFVCIEEYHPGSDHRSFQRKVDYLVDHRIPFGVAMTPGFENPLTGTLETLDSRPEFAQSLQYAQSRGGRIILRGLIHREAAPFEFWDQALDRPPAGERTETIRSSMQQAIEELIRHDLYPLAWRTPGDAASSTFRGIAADFFSTTLGRLQLTDATRLETYSPASLSQNGQGRRLVPENLGHIPLAVSNGGSLMQQRAELLLGLRGTLATCEIHAYIPFETFTMTMAWLEDLETPFLDLATLDSWTEWPGGLLLTAHASRKTTAPPGSMIWKAIDSSGRVINEFHEPNVTDRERLFRNRGAGVVEYYQFLGSQP